MHVGAVVRDVYQRAQADYDELRVLLPKFAQSKAYFRASEPVLPAIRREIQSTGIPASNRDRAVCVLANKAVNTHCAIRSLTDTGQGDDAMALGRVLGWSAGVRSHRSNVRRVGSRDPQHSAVDVLVRRRLLRTERICSLDR